ncbi:MAG: hypothetical protein QOE23_1325 [Pseudonocardiales bacterium]|jgi:DNA-binding CsgD family transcriptional regulator|nr:hypothetical protein [Pseudonocardiales bacterium]
MAARSWQDQPHQIGASLFISTRTASVHVPHILRKLHVTLRVRAATGAEGTTLS